MNVADPPAPEDGDAPAPPSRRRRWSLRGRLAAGITAVALAVVVVVVAGTALALARWGDHPEVRGVTRVEQVGDRVAIVRIEQDVGGAAGADAARSQALRWALVAAAVAAVPTALAAWVVAGRLLRPLGRLEGTVARLEAAAGSPSPGSPPATGSPPAPGSPPTHGDEVDALQGGVERLVEGFAAREAVQARRLQEVVHELRTPLAVASANLELADDDPAAPDAPDRLAAARRAVDRMARTVDDLAQHGRLAPGRGDELVDLAAEGRALAAEHRGPAAGRDLRVAVAGPATLEVIADRPSVRTAVGNFLANALRLAPSGSTVVVGWGVREGWAWIGVRDEGPGVAPVDHAHVFERNWRGRADRDRDRDADPHRGLGLTIARQVVEAQGGHVTVASAEGGGSSFVAWLPLGPGARTDAVVSVDGVHAAVDPFSEPASA